MIFKKTNNIRMPKLNCYIIWSRSFFVTIQIFSCLWINKTLFTKKIFRNSIISINYCIVQRHKTQKINFININIKFFNKIFDQLKMSIHNRKMQGIMIINTTTHKIFIIKNTNINKIFIT